MGSHDPEREAIQPYAQGVKPAASDRAADAPVVVPNIAKERLTTFLDRELSEPRPWPILAILTLIASAIGFAFSVVFASLYVLLAAGVGPLVITIVLWLARPPALRLRFSEDGITFLPADYHLPYEQINKVFAPQRGDKARFRILLLCEGGHVTLTPKLTDDSEELYQFLRSQSLGLQSIPTDVDPAFSQFLRQQLTLHDAKQLTIYQARQWHEKRLVRNSWRCNAGLRVALALFVGGGYWWAAFFLANPPSMPGLAVAGANALIMSFLFLIGGLLAKTRTKVPKKMRKATLFISPSGLALSQAELKGELRWSEITKVKRPTATNFALSSSEMAPGVWLHVKGATIFVADIYQWPAEHIEWLIRKHSGL
jgi:hypothetical protein